MKITNASEYAIRAILHMALNPEKVYTISEIFSEVDAPQKFLAKILQKLSAKKILASSRGVKGGFKLNKPIDKISLFEIYECVDGPMALNKCLIDGYKCQREITCPIHKVWEKAQNQLKETLSEKSIKDLIEEYKNNLLS